MTSVPTRQEAVLAALAAGILGPAYDPAVPGRMLEILGRLASRRDRDQLAAVLRALDSRAGALLLTGRPAPLSGCSPAAAEAVVRRWGAARLPPRRRLAAAVGPVALLAAYAWPGPARDATGYPGPLGPAPDVPRRLAPLRLDGDEELACDVAVVGSGAGGGVVAAELARAGLDVVVLEKGGYAAERDFHHQEGDAYRDLYLYAQTLTTDDLACRIVAGSTLGGGTVVNYSTSFATPPAVLAEWAAVSGVAAFASGEVAASLEAVAGRLGVTEGQSRPGARDQLLERGLERLGWHAGPLPRNVRGCAQDAGCGWCGFGCRLGAKQSTLVTYLEEAAAAGARLVVGADVRRVLISPSRPAGQAGPGGGAGGGGRRRAPAGGQGAGGGGRRRGGRDPGPAAPLRPRRPGRPAPAPAPRHRRHGRVPRAGALVGGDPPGPLVGRAAPAPRPVRPDLRDRARAPGDGRGRPALAVGRRPPGADGTLGQPVAGRGALPRQRRRPGPGRPRRQPPGPLPAQRRRRGPHGRRGGRRRGGPGRRRGQRGVQHPPPAVLLPPRRPGAHRAWADATRQAGFAGGRATLASYHQMGSCRMGADPATSAVGPDHQTHQVKGLYVADASLFPTASGVNPMLSVMALAHRAAGRIAAALWLVTAPGSAGRRPGPRGSHTPRTTRRHRRKELDDPGAGP